MHDIVAALMTEQAFFFDAFKDKLPVPE